MTHYGDIRILAVNLGHRYIGLAVLYGAELREWAVKTLRSLSSDEAIARVEKILSDYVNRYDIQVLALKKLHPARCSSVLPQMVLAAKRFARSKKLALFECSLSELKKTLLPRQRANKNRIMEAMTDRFPFLFRELERERRHKHPYFVRVFEAIAVGVTCFMKLERSRGKGRNESVIHTLHVE